jgi:hypothetical protein
MQDATIFSPVGEGAIDMTTFSKHAGVGIAAVVTLFAAGAFYRVTAQPPPVEITSLAVGEIPDAFTLIRAKRHDGINTRGSSRRHQTGADADDH